MLEDFLASASPLDDASKSATSEAAWRPRRRSRISPDAVLFHRRLHGPQRQTEDIRQPDGPEVFGMELNFVDRRDAPLMYSTVDGAIALGRNGKPSHFAEALARGLDRAAEEADESPDYGR